jgi:hypothetical protein
VTRGILIVLLLVAAASCASGGGRATGVFAQDIGRATPTELDVQVPRILALHQFEVERTAPAPNYYVETRWRDRNPLNDELLAGVEAVQVRAFVTARPRSATVDANFYTVDMKVEQRVRVMWSDEWVVTEPSAMGEEYAKDIIQDLRQALDVGVHRR